MREGTSYGLHGKISPKWAIIHVQAAPGNFLWVVEWWVNEGIALFFTKERTLRTIAVNVTAHPDHNKRSHSLGRIQV